MHPKISLFIKKFPERYAAKIFSNMFWPPSTVSVLCHGENDDVLALKLGDQYRLPGGFINRGEGLKEAAKREVREETGFEIEVKNLLDIRQNGGGGPNIFFEAEVVEGEKDGSWEGEPEFIHREEIRDKVWKLEHSHIHKYLFPE